MIPAFAILIGLTLLIGGLPLTFILIYNRLVGLRNRVAEGWSGIDVQLKRRHELIPNLVATLRAYRDYERETLETVTRLRSIAEAATSVPISAEAEESLGRGLKSAMILAEGYPDLKADQNFREFMKQLVVIEDDLQYARRYYNGAVRDLNNALESFPSSLVGKMAAFQKADFFEVSQTTEREGTDVRL